jgi:hypothetical protein
LAFIWALVIWYIKSKTIRQNTQVGYFSTYSKIFPPTKMVFSITSPCQVVLTTPSYVPPLIPVKGLIYPLGDDGRNVQQIELYETAEKVLISSKK